MPTPQSKIQNPKSKIGTPVPVPVGRWLRWRAVVVFTGLGAVLIAAAGRVVWIQVLRHDHYARLAIRQHVRTTELPASCGRILDRKYRLLATSTQVPSICADPAAIVDKVAVAARLAAALRIDRRDLRRRLIGHGHKRFMWVARKVDRTSADRVKALKLEGVWIEKEPQRLYPCGRLAAHVIGFRGIDDTGLEGIERQYDDRLRGAPGEERYRVDALGRRIAGRDSFRRPPVPGASVVTTLDSVVQHILEDELDRVVEQWNPVSVSAVVMVPGTGEVLALANRPTFDLGEFRDCNPDARRNRCLTDPVEPGSTFKPFVASAVLARQMAGLDERFFCYNGLYVTHGRRLRDHHPYGWLTFLQIVFKSSNIGMARLGEMLGARALQQTLAAYGFGRRTGIDLPGESPGIVTTPRAWTHYTTTSVPMGHEIATTPIQLATAFCAIANGGYLVRPRVVRCLINAEGEIVEDRRAPITIRRVLPAQVAHTMVDPVLTNVVEVGTGKRARLTRYRVFGKTGTAQKALPGGGGYSHTAFVASFMGAAPAERPRICVLLMVNEPRTPGSRYGGTVAAPAVARVIERTLDYLMTTPSVEPPWPTPRTARLDGPVGPTGDSRLGSPTGIARSGAMR